MVFHLAPRRILAATLVAAAFALPAAAPAETTLRFVPASELKILDPIWTTALITRAHGFMIYDTLFGMAADGEIRPQMVADYSASDDHKTWEFTLRPGLKFHDGAPVTADDVIASLARWSKRDALGQKMYAALDSIEATGENSFRMTFTQPFAAVLDALGKPNPPVPFIMPKRVAETPADKQIDDLTGSGPFMLAKGDFRPGGRVTYHKNPDYMPRSDAPSGFAGAKAVKVDRMDWVMLGDPQTQANALLNGEVDLLEVIPSGRFQELKKSPSVELLYDLRPGGTFTAHFNHKIPPFDNPKIIQAAMLAINQKALLKAQSPEAPELMAECPSIYVCGSRYASDDTGFFTGKPQFDKAKALLKEAGYDGKPVVLMLPGDFPFLRTITTVYGELLKLAGFQLDVQSVDWGTLVSRRASKAPVDQGGWNTFVTYWGAEDASNPLTYTPLTGTGDAGYFGWPDVPELVALQQQFLDTTDADKRAELAAKIQTAALEAGVLVPLGNARGPIPVRKGVVSGVIASPAATVVPWNIEKKE